MATNRVENTGQALLDLLAANGIEYLFANAGSDFASIIDGLARAARLGLRSPKPVLCPHESAGVSAAHAYALATGRPAAVMVHSTVGTGNAVCALLNAARAHAPILFLAGHPPLAETGVRGAKDLCIHWAQQLPDQNGLVRQFVKWDFRVDSPNRLEGAVRRGLAIAMTEPMGPVYISIPRDVLEAPVSNWRSGPPAVAWGAASPACPHPEPVRQLADWIANASFPLIVTRSYGKSAEAVAALVRLAESFAIAVTEFQIPEFVNFPASHALHQGYPLDRNPLLAEADLVIALDNPMPWTPAVESPRAGARIAHIGPDPLQTPYPVWGFDGHLWLTGNSLLTVEALAAQLNPRRTGNEDRIAARFANLAARSAKRRELSASATAEPGEGPASFAWLSRCLRHAIDAVEPEAIVIQEYDLDLEQSAFDRPGSCYGFSASGGLGFGVGGALGLALAKPERTVISVVGDGTYLLGSPEACHMIAATHRLPVLWVVCNNRGWQRVAFITGMLHPRGAAAETGTFPLTQFPPVRFELICQAAGGDGETVAAPGDLPAALQRGLRSVKEHRRQYLLNVECGPL